jgi:hypothetical protein
MVGITLKNSIKNIFVSGLICLGSISCQPYTEGERKSEKAKSDSVAFADSISQIELAKQEVIAAAIDSAKDSIARASKTAK